MRVWVGLVAAAAVLLTSAIERADASSWRKSNSTYCEKTCDQYGGAASSGNHKDTIYPYYVCRVDMGGQGERSGYNLKRYGAGERRCVVGFGRKEVANSDFDCLCRR